VAAADTGVVGAGVVSVVAGMAGEAAGGVVETAAVAAAGVGWVAAACVLSEAYCSRAPSARRLGKAVVEGPGAGSGWVSTGAVGADSGGLAGWASSAAGAVVGCGATARVVAGGACSEIGYVGLAILNGAGPGPWSSLIG
jgi:hypothetical protein